MSLPRADRTTVLVVASAAAAGVSLVDGGEALAQAQAAAPALALAVIVLAGVAVLRRRVVPALVALIAAVVMLAPVLTPPPGPVARGPRTLSVLSANTYVGGLDPAALLAEIDRRHVDVLVLPEMSDALWHTLATRGLLARLPHATGRSGMGRGMVVATREPVTCVELPPGVTCGRVTMDDRRGPIAYDAAGRPAFDQITVALPDGTHVRGVHLWSPRMAPTARWRENQGEMADWVARQPADRPLIVAGDYNAGRSHPVFRRYAAHLDEVPFGGFPWTRTWPRWDLVPRFTQLDHILVRGRRAVESETVALPGSDHDAVWALLTR